MRPRQLLRGFKEGYGVDIVLIVGRGPPSQDARNEANREAFGLIVMRASKPGLYAGGARLYLRVTPQGTRNWVYRYMLAGKARWMGLGPFPLLSLRVKRQKARQARRILQSI